MFQRLSASKLPIASECPAAFALPAHGLPSSPWARRGTVIHRFLDVALRDGRDVALSSLEEEDDEIAAFCAKIPLHEIIQHFGGTPRTEIQFAYDPISDEAREFRPDEPVTVDWLPGRIDAHRLLPDRVIGADFKTGMMRVPSPLVNLQMRAYALMLARRYDQEVVEFSILDIDEDGFPFVRRSIFEEMELDAARADLVEIMHAVTVEREGRALAARVGGTYEPRVVAGDHCRYCEALPNCPAFAGTSQALVSIHDRTHGMTPERLGEIYSQANAVQLALDRIQSAIRFQVEERGLTIPLPSGKVLRAVDRRSRTISGKIAQEVMQERGLGLAFLTAADVTFVGIERACGDLAKEVLSEIERRGGVTTKTYSRARETKPQSGDR